MATLNAYLAYIETPSYVTNWRKIGKVWAFANEAVPANLPSGMAILESSKDVPRNVHTAVEDWFVNIVTGEVSFHLPADTSATAQRHEIKSIIIQSYYEFNRHRFFTS